MIALREKDTSLSQFVGQLNEWYTQIAVDQERQAAARRHPSGFHSDLMTTSGMTSFETFPWSLQAYAKRSWAPLKHITFEFVPDTGVAYELPRQEFSKIALDMAAAWQGHASERHLFVDQENVLDWNFSLEKKPERPKRTIRARIVHHGRGKPMPFDNPWV